MRVRVYDPGTDCCFDRSGRIVDVSDVGVDGETVVQAIREGDATARSGRSITVACLQSGLVHDRIGHVHPEMCLRVRTALAAAARSRGHTAPQDERRREIATTLAGLERQCVPDAEAARRRLANADADVERLRERVATIRGRLSAAREAGRETDPIEADLTSATRELSAAETERIAARETVERTRSRAREARDRRERRRRLEDELANHDRAARAQLVEEFRDGYADAVTAVPGPDPTDPFDADPVTAALAIGRLSRLHAPVVIDCDRFTDADAAASFLDAPIAWL